MRKRHLIPVLLMCALVLLAGCSAQQETPTTAAAEASSAEVSTPTAQVEGGEPAEPAPPAEGGEPGEAAPPAEGGEDGPQRGPGGPGGFGGASQLALNTLYLQSTDYAITADQAKTLLPLWQELQSLQAGDEINPEQIQALIEEINGQMTGEQTAFLADLSQEDLAAWAEEQGYMAGFGGPPSEMGEGGPPEMSEDERATAQAERPEGSPENPPEDMPEGAQPAAPANNLVDEVISMLESLAAG